VTDHNCSVSFWTLASPFVLWVNAIPDTSNIREAVTWWGFSQPRCIAPCPIPRRERRAILRTPAVDATMSCPLLGSFAGIRGRASLPLAVGYKFLAAIHPLPRSQHLRHIFCGSQPRAGSQSTGPPWRQRVRASEFYRGGMMCCPCHSAGGPFSIFQL
jgi:hypothetical protein